MITVPLSCSPADGSAVALSCYPQPARHQRDKILHIRDNRGGGKAAAIQKFVDYKLVSINCIKIEWANFSIRHNAEGRRHISSGYRVQHGSKTDDCCTFPHKLTHLRLSFVDVANNLRQRTIIADRPCQNDRYVVFDTAIDNAIINSVIIDKRGNRSAAAYLVDYILIKSSLYFVLAYRLFLNKAPKNRRIFRGFGVSGQNRFFEKSGSASLLRRESNAASRNEKQSDIYQSVAFSKTRNGTEVVISELSCVDKKMHW